VKKLLCVLLSLLLLIPGLPVSALAEGEVPTRMQIRVTTDETRFVTVYQDVTLDYLFSAEDLAAFSSYALDIGPDYIEFRRGSKIVYIYPQTREYGLDFTGDPSLGGMAISTYLGETQLHQDAEGRWYLAGSVLIPLLNLSAFTKDGTLVFLPDPVSFWDLIGEFDPGAFDMDYLALCEELDKSGKWFQAGAYLRDKGFSLWSDGIYIPGSDGKFYNLGESRNYEEIFYDMVKDVTSGEYMAHLICKNASLTKPLSELMTDGADYRELPDWLNVYAAFQTLSDTFAKVMDVAAYTHSLTAMDQVRWAQLQMINDPYFTAPVPMKAAADKLLFGAEHPILGSIERLAGNIADDSLKDILTMGLDDGLPQLLAKNAELYYNLHPPVHQGIARLDVYDAVAAAFLQEYQTGLPAGQVSAEDILQMDYAIAGFLYARGKNLQALADLAREEGRSDLAEGYDRQAEAARSLEAQFLLAASCAENDAITDLQGPANDTIRQELFPLVTASGKEVAAPQMDMTQAKTDYENFMGSLAWISDLTIDLSDYSNPSQSPELRGSAYYYHDIDKNGIQELILIPGTANANAQCLIYSWWDGIVTLKGRIRCAWTITPVGSEKATGLYLYEYHGGASYLELVEFTGDAFEGVANSDEQTDLTVPEGWDALEMAGVIDEHLSPLLPWPDAVRQEVLGGRFEIFLPAHWMEHIAITESEMGFEVYERAHLEMGYPGGWLFSVYLSGYTEESQIAEPSYEILGTWGGGNLILATFPTDVQANLDSPELAELYAMLYADAHEVASHVRLID